MYSYTVTAGGSSYGFTDRGGYRTVQKYPKAFLQKDISGTDRNPNPPPQSGDYPRNRIVGWSTVA